MSNSLRVTGLAGILGLCLAGCSVVKSNTDVPTFKTLAAWQGQAETAPASDKYTNGQIAVNAWIEAVKTKIAITGSQLWGSVDLKIPQDVETAAAAGLAGAPAGPAGWEDSVFNIIDKIIARVQSARKDEAAAVNARLDAFKWPSK